MGEKADEILHGDICQFCGQMFIDDGDGYPRTCQACIEDGMEDHLKKEINLDEPAS